MKNRGKTFLIIIIVLSFLVVAFSVFLLIRKEKMYSDAREEYGGILEFTKIELNNVTYEEDKLSEGKYDSLSEDETSFMKVDEKSLISINEDYRGWIYIPALSLSYPLVQGKDNDYYLSHTFYKERNNSGSAFLDYINAPDFSDRNTFIYAHNMRDDSMFGSLNRFKDESELCKSNPFLYIFHNGNVYKYRIFSYYVTDTSKYYENPAEDRYRLIGRNGEELNNPEYISYRDYVDKAIELSLFEGGDIYSYGEPDIITLSTCYGAYGTDRRFIVHAFLTDDSME